MKYLGSCHCGRIKFEAEGEIDGAMSCNCSMCQRKGSLMWFLPRESLRLLTPEEDTDVYLFNNHRIRHVFCSRCGIHPYGEATSPAGLPMAAINIRCIEDIDLAAIPVRQFDGRSV